MKALVTGHQGFVGRHMTRTLADRGWEVTGADLASGVDCTDLFARDDTRFDLAVHCAATVGGRKTIEGKPLEVARNLVTDAAMFTWALRTRPRRLVYYSSSAVYPVEIQARGIMAHSLDEGDTESEEPWRYSIGPPDAVYGWCKRIGELLAEMACAEGVRTYVLRPFSGYGTDQDLDYPFPAFIRRALGREDPFTIWGDGTQTRDFVHIDDVIACTLAVIEAENPGPVNIGTGRPISFNDLQRMVCEAAGHSPAVEHDTTAPVGCHYRVADTKLMERYYTPTVTLEEGIMRALRGVL